MFHENGRTTQLHTGLSGVTKVIISAYLIFGAFVIAPLLGGIGGLFAGQLSLGAGFAVGVSIAMLCCAVLLGRLLWVLRSAAWLEQTTLVVRGALKSRRCDLSLAKQLRLDYVAETTPLSLPFITLIVPTGRRLPCIAMRDRNTGRTLRFKLIDPGTKQMLGPVQLMAIADAIDRHRGEYADMVQARQTASVIRGLITSATRQQL